MTTLGAFCYRFGRAYTPSRTVLLRCDGEVGTPVGRGRSPGESGLRLAVFLLALVPPHHPGEDHAETDEEDDEDQGPDRVGFERGLGRRVHGGSSDGKHGDHAGKKSFPVKLSLVSDARRPGAPNVQPPSLRGTDAGLSFRCRIE